VAVLDVYYVLLRRGNRKIFGRNFIKRI